MCDRRAAVEGVRFLRKHTYKTYIGWPLVGAQMDMLKNGTKCLHWSMIAMTVVGA